MRLCETKLYDIFDGEEIDLFRYLINDYLQKLELKKDRCDDKDICDALNNRIRKICYLYDDVSCIFGEMLKDGHYDDIRSKHKIQGFI
jgi:hypothetical protein